MQRSLGKPHLLQTSIFLFSTYSIYKGYINIFHWKDGLRYELKAALFGNIVAVILFRVSLTNVRLIILDGAGKCAVIVIYEMLARVPDLKLQAAGLEIFNIGLDADVGAKPSKVFGKLVVRHPAHVHVYAKVPAAVTTLLAASGPLHVASRLMLLALPSVLAGIYSFHQVKPSSPVLELCFPRFLFERRLWQRRIIEGVERPVQPHGRPIKLLCLRHIQFFPGDVRYDLTAFFPQQGRYPVHFGDIFGRQRPTLFRHPEDERPELNALAIHLDLGGYDGTGERELFFQLYEKGIPVVFRKLFNFAHRCLYLYVLRQNTFSRLQFKRCLQRESGKDSMF